MLVNQHLLLLANFFFGWPKKIGRKINSYAIHAAYEMFAKWSGGAFP